jgi:hypothetical protein
MSDSDEYSTVKFEATAKALGQHILLTCGRASGCDAVLICQRDEDSD